MKEIKAAKKQNGLIEFKSLLILTNMFIFWSTGCEMILNRASLKIYLLFETLKRRNSHKHTHKNIGKNSTITMNSIGFNFLAPKK